jgi:dipeptidyl aminopeptidase/acylaminoacyl peptidase
VASDPNVDLILSHFTPRYVATGVDPNDLQQLVKTIDRWDDWCRLWCEAGFRHEILAREAADKGRRRTAAEAHLRAAIYYHYAKHMFAADPIQFRDAHERMLRCYSAAAPDLDPPLHRLTFPYQGTEMVGWLRKPHGVAKPPVAVILPGLDACKEELHAWAEAFVERGVATLTLDGPGQGETSFRLPITPDWGPVLGAVIDVLERRSDVDGTRVGVVGQSLGAFYAPMAAAFEPRLKACVANCGPYDFGQVLPKMPVLSQQVFAARSHAPSIAEGLQIAKRLTLQDAAHRITCPLLVVFGAGDRLIAPEEGERLAREASGPAELVVYPEGNHVCFNISYKFRPLTADWIAERL